MDVKLTKLIVVTISQNIHVLNHYVVHLKLTKYNVICQLWLNKKENFKMQYIYKVLICW